MKGVAREKEVPMKPPYPYEIFGHCAGCGAAEDRMLERVSPPNVFRYRCRECVTRSVAPAPGCLHALVKLPKPIPTQTGKPWRYRCEKCRLRFKIATGVVLGV